MQNNLRQIIKAFMLPHIQVNHKPSLETVVHQKVRFGKCIWYRFEVMVQK